MGPVFVYTAFAVICLGSLFRPSVGAVGYIGFVAFTPQWLWRFQLDSTFPFQKWIAVCLIVGWLFSFLKTKNLDRSSLIPLGSLALVLGLAHLSSLQSYAPEQSEFFLRQFNKIVLMTLLITLTLSSGVALRSAIWVMAVGITFNAFEINSDYYQRGYSLVNQDGWSNMNANAYALVMLIGVFLTFCLAVHAKSSLTTIAWLLSSLINTHAIMIVESRGAMLGLIAGALMLLVFMRPTSRNFMLTAAIGFGILFLTGPVVVKEFSSIFAEKLDNSGESRFYIWDAGVRLTLDYPMLGVGPWAGECLLPTYYSGTDKLGTDKIALHNLELEVSTGMGIPAVIAYLIFFFVPWNSARKILWQQRRTPSQLASATVQCAVIAIPGYWVASQFNSGALVEIPYLFVSVLIADVIHSRRDNPALRAHFDSLTDKRVASQQESVLPPRVLQGNA